MIFEHYRELVTEADAKQWFSIAPSEDGKVIYLPATEQKADSAKKDVKVA
jgi:hypothetical protein